MKKYDTYKDSDIEWIGEIPSHWEIGRFKYLYRFVNEKCVTELPKIGLEHIESWTGRLIKNDTEFEGEGICFQETDILFGKLRPYLAKVYIADFAGKAVGDFFVFRPAEQIYPEYGHKFLLSQNFIGITNSSTFGSKMPRVSPEFISDLKVIAPPPKEQTAIARYLDRKTAEIDELIADKKRLLELYEEEKTALINQAVTQGLDPNVPMRDSGIEWLGEIPAYWEVKKLKYIAKLRSGNNIVSEQIKENAKYPVFGGNGTRGYFDDFTNEGDHVLIGRQGAYCGNIQYANGKFWASEHAVVLTPLINYEYQYLGEILRTMNLGQYSVSAAQPGLAVETIKNLKVPFPPEEEQLSIVHFLNTELSRIDRQVSRTQRLIDLLTEYRTALISEVVTGKVKVTD